jgi:hypothetical protein
MRHKSVSSLCCGLVMALSTVCTVAAERAEAESNPTQQQKIKVETSTQAAQSAMSTEKISVQKSLILSAISEPEEGLVRQFLLETNGNNEILRLTIKPDKGDVLTYDLDTLLKEEVLVSSYTGINAVLMKTQLTSPKEALLKIRYLKLIPSTYDTFDLRVRLNEKNAWTVYQSDNIHPVSWVLFRSKNFLGTAIGIEKIDFYTEKPALAH